MALSIDTTLLTNVCTWVGKAHNSYMRVVGDEADQNGPFYWLEAVKSYCRGGNDLTTGITSGSAINVTANGTPAAVVNITGGHLTLNNQDVTVTTNTAFGTTTIFTQTCTDHSPLVAGQFYDCFLCADHLGVPAIFRGPREDRTDAESQPAIPAGYCTLAKIRINYQAANTVINTADITLGQTLTNYSGPVTDPPARMFNDFDAGQTKLISRTAVKNELGFALTSLDKYVQTITASLGLGTAGAGLTLLAWAKTTHQTVSPWDFPAGFAEYIRILRNGKDPSQRLATVSFTGSGTATIADQKKVIGFQDKFEVVVVTVAGTGSAPSTITATFQSTGATTAAVYTATVPASQPNGTVIPMIQSGTTVTQTPIPGTAPLAIISASNVLSAQPAGTVATRLYTSLVATSPISVTGGTNLDVFALRNTGTL